MFDRAGRARLKAAGRRFHAAERERHLALEDLKQILLEADGDISDEDAAALVDVAVATVHVLKDPGRFSDPGTKG